MGDRVVLGDHVVMGGCTFTPEIGGLYIVTEDIYVYHKNALIRNTPVISKGCLVKWCTGVSLKPWCQVIFGNARVNGFFIDTNLLKPYTKGEY